MAPADVPTLEFRIYQHLKHDEDDSQVFPNVARIQDAMLRKVDPTNPILVAYLLLVNPSVETGVFLPKGIVGCSKRGKSPKKPSKDEKSKVVPEVVEKAVTKPVPEYVQETVVQDIHHEVVPSKSGVLKQMKKPAHRPLHSPDPKVVVEEQFISSPKWVFVTKLQKIRKPHINRKGVIIRETPAPVSPTSKK